MISNLGKRVVLLTTVFFLVAAAALKTSAETLPDYITLIVDQSAWAVLACIPPRPNRETGAELICRNCPRFPFFYAVICGVKGRTLVITDWTH